jgi:hypothetical protein
VEEEERTFSARIEMALSVKTRLKQTISLVGMRIKNRKTSRAFTPLSADISIGGRQENGAEGVFEHATTLPPSAGNAPQGGFRERVKAVLPFAPVFAATRRRLRDPRLPSDYYIGQARTESKYDSKRRFWKVALNATATLTGRKNMTPRSLNVTPSQGPDFPSLLPNCVQIIILSQKVL